MIPNYGPVTVRKIIAHYQNAQNFFSELKSTKSRKFLRLPSDFDSSKIIEQAHKELEIIEKNNIKVLFFTQPEFPKNLNSFDDLPVILFVKGNFVFKNTKYVSIVGTRAMTQYGQMLCERFVDDLAQTSSNICIVSGLAYGIDITAHKAALKNNIPTIAVLGHGLNYIYPAIHKNFSQKILSNGALITEYNFFTKPHPTHFARRNRIIAALADAVVIVETAKKGGALITAEFANTYDKDIFTFPGRVCDKMSEGCNYLIKTNRATLIENAQDFLNFMNWSSKKTNIQLSLPIFNEEQQKIIDILKEDQQVHIDAICAKSQMSMNQVLSVLFELEFQKIIAALPGRMYKLLI